VQKPSEGAFAYPSGLARRADEAERKSIETLGCRRSGANLAVKARERRSDEIPVKAFAGILGRVKPRGATSSRCAKHTLDCQGLGGRVKAQEPRLAEPALASSGAKVYRRAKRYVGSSGRKRPGYLPRGESSEGQIPGALPVRNKTGAGYEGNKPSRG
jgi:hypothetical protein